MINLRASFAFRSAVGVTAAVLVSQLCSIGSVSAFPGDSLLPKGLRFSKQEKTSSAASQTMSQAESQTTSSKTDDAKEIVVRGANELQSVATASPKELTVEDLQMLAQHPSEIPNLRMVSGRLLRGGQPTAQGFSLLKQAGVKTIVNLRNEPVLMEKERRSAELLGLNYVSLPMYTVQEPESKQFQAFLDVVTDPAQGPVFVHCFHGRDRTGTVIGAYRIAVEKWTFDNAFNEMMACGFRPAFAPLTQGLHKFAQARGDKSPMPTASFIMSDLKKRFLH